MRKGAVIQQAVTIAVGDGEDDDDDDDGAPPGHAAGLAPSHGALLPSVWSSHRRRSVCGPIAYRLNTLKSVSDDVCGIGSTGTR